MTRPNVTPARRAGAHLLAMAAALYLLVGCGGGGGSAANAPAAPAPPPVAVTPTPPVTPPPPTSTAVPTGYVLVWSDEFNVDGLPDAGLWDYDTERNREGWFNNERQYYAKQRLENSRNIGGVLHISALREQLQTAPDWGGQFYTSARLVTRGKKE